jgi:hypothetical protein
MTGYTHTVTKLIEPDVLQLLQGLAGTKHFDEMVKNPNSQENKLLAMVGAIAAHKNLTERLIGEVASLVAVAEKTLGLRLQNRPQPTDTYDDEEEEIQDRDNRARITRLTQQLQQKQAELSAYLEKGKEQYQSCQQLLKQGAVAQISNALNQHGLGDDPAVADAVYDLYETRQQNKANIISQLITLQPQMSRSDISQEALNKRIDQNFDVGTQVLLVGLLRNSANSANLQIELRSYLEATNSVDKLFKLYAKVMSAVAKDYEDFVQKAEAADPQATQALSELQRTMEAHRRPQYSTSATIEEIEEESEQQADKKTKLSGGLG